MHVCLICIEFFGFGTHGGFGRATRLIGRELVRSGIKVTVVVPRRSADYPDVCELDGMTILQFNPFSPWSALALYKSCAADIYHSQDTSLGTYLAMAAMKDSRHVVTFRDPLDENDWRIETEFLGKGRIGWYLYRLYIDNPLVASAIRKAHSLYCAAEFLIPKVMKKYALRRTPGFLPTPVAIPDSVSKAGRPTVCFVSRWDGRKRPERFFEIARKFPEVDFIAVGGARDKKRDCHLRRTYSGITNLEMTGVIDQFSTGKLGQILEKSWILINTSPREGLPNAFLEAAAHRCAILSYTDPDCFASRFGYHVREGSIEEGLEFLLSGDRWRVLGERGYQYVRRIFEVGKAMEAHLEAYDHVLHEAV